MLWTNKTNVCICISVINLIFNLTYSWKVDLRKGIYMSSESCTWWKHYFSTGMLMIKNWVVSNSTNEGRHLHLLILLLEFFFFFTNYKYNFNFFLWCASIALVYTYRDYKLTCRLQQTICRECVCHYTAIREAELKTSICAVEWGKDNVGRCLSIWQTAGTLQIGKFWVAFHLCFKASPSVKPFIWKLVLFTCKQTQMYM